MGVLYIKTRTLIVPIACHGLNNFLVVVIGLLSSGSKTASSVTSLEQLRSGWWVGVLLMVVSLTLLVRNISKNWPRKDAVIPYLINANQEGR